MHAARTTRALDDPPGGILMWIVVGLELAAFGVLFLLIGWMRLEDPGAFSDGARQLDPATGLRLTLALLTSGWLVAEAVGAYRAKKLALARRFYVGAIATGLVFVGLKIHDTAAKIGAGHGLGSSDFWDAYLLGTGFHFLHVMVGLGLLISVAPRIRPGSPGARFEDEETAIAGTALFWHMCDVAWFFLFPLFYVRS